MPSAWSLASAPQPRRRLREELEGTSDRKLPSCRIIPERGSWIEVNVTKKDALNVRIDQSGKFSAVTLLRAMSPSTARHRPDPASLL